MNANLVITEVEFPASETFQTFLDSKTSYNFFRFAKKKDERGNNLLAKICSICNEDISYLLMKMAMSKLSPQQNAELLLMENKAKYSVLSGIGRKYENGLMGEERLDEIHQESVNRMRIIMQVMISQADGEKVFRDVLRQIEKSSPDLYTNLADLISQAILITPQEKINAAIGGCRQAQWLQTPNGLTFHAAPDVVAKIEPIRFDPK